MTCAVPRPSPLDPSVLECLRELERAGSKGLLGRMAHLFLDDAGKHLEALSRAVESKDTEQFRRIAHGLKSASANVGALTLSRMFRELEGMGRAGLTEGAGTLLGSILEELTEVRSALLEAAPERERGPSVS